MTAGQEHSPALPAPPAGFRWVLLEVGSCAHCGQLVCRDGDGPWLTLPERGRIFTESGPPRVCDARPGDLPHETGTSEGRKT